MVTWSLGPNKYCFLIECGLRLVPKRRFFQGVLLLNSVLTVRPRIANSHAGMGWEDFTDAVIRTIDQHTSYPVVFMLWGKVEFDLNL